MYHVRIEDIEVGACVGDAHGFEVEFTVSDYDVKIGSHLKFPCRRDGDPSGFITRAAGCNNSNKDIRVVDVVRGKDGEWLDVTAAYGYDGAWFGIVRYSLWRKERNT